jgi:hypothetical protein
VVPGVSFTVKVQAKDSAGVDLNVGGDLFYADFRDECSWSNLFTCTESGGSTNNVIDIIQRFKMTDNGDGTYEYTYVTSKEGKVTVTVFLYDRTDRVFARYYDCPSYKSCSSTLRGTQYKSLINEDYDFGDIYSTQGDNIKTVFETVLLPTATKPYTFKIYGDDNAKVYLDGIQIIESEWSLSLIDTLTIPLYANRPYYVKVEHEEKNGESKILFSWDDTGILAAIPSANFGYPQEVETINITSHCPAFTTLSGGACITPLI